MQIILDPLDTYLDEAIYGSIALVSKDYYDIIRSRLGQNKLDICILKHYIENPVYSNLFTQLEGNVDGKIVTYELSLNIIAKKKLRKIIGPQLYLENNEEVFFESDLEYIANMCNDGHYIRFIVPRNVCIFCKKIKTYFSSHPRCWDEFYRTHIAKKGGESLYIKNYNDDYVDKTQFIEMCLCSCVRTLKLHFNFEYLCPELMKLCEG